MCIIYRSAVQGTLTVKRYTDSQPQLTTLDLPTYATAQTTSPPESEPPYRITTLLGAAFTEFAPLKPSPPRLQRPPGGACGPIETFSPGARKRMRELLAKLKHKSVVTGLAGGLTYPDDYPTPSQAGLHFSRLRKRIARAYPNAFVVWRLEYQERGAIHFHLLILGAPDMTHHWLRQSWCECTDTDNPRDPRHKNRAYLKPVRNREKWTAYIAKHQPRQLVPHDHTGRFWGHFGDAAPFMGEARTYTATRSQIRDIQRELDKLWLKRTAKILNPLQRARALVAVGHIIECRSPNTRFSYFNSLEEHMITELTGNTNPATALATRFEISGGIESGWQLVERLPSRRARPKRLPETSAHGAETFPAFREAASSGNRRS